MGDWMRMQRREFITLLGGGAAATAITWPRSARPQDAARRIAVIIGSSESDPSVLPRVAALRQGLSLPPLGNITLGFCKTIPKWREALVRGPMVWCEVQ
jgi:hypothetical protein